MGQTRFQRFHWVHGRLESLDLWHPRDVGHRPDCFDECLLRAWAARLLDAEQQVVYHADKLRPGLRDNDGFNARFSAG